MADSRGPAPNGSLNLNGPTADSVQLDYISKEQQAAKSLLIIQTKNAEDLAKKRLALLTELMEETKQRGEEVETGLSEFKAKKFLENLAAEIREIKTNYTKLYTEQLQLQQKNSNALRQAEADLASFRLSAIKLESTQRLKDIAVIEKATIDSLKRRSAIDPSFSLDMDALASAETEINSTITDLDGSLRELEAARLKQTVDAIKREAELRSGYTAEEFEQRKDLLKSMIDTAVDPEGLTAALHESFNTISADVTTVNSELATSFSGLEAAVSGTASDVATSLEGLSEAVDNAAEVTEKASEIKATTPEPPAEDPIAKLKAGWDAQTQAEYELHQLKVRHLTTEHIQAMLYSDKGLSKYKVTLAQQIAMEEELVRRKKEFESDTIAALFAEREEAEQKQAAELDKKHAASLKAKLASELDYLQKIKTETGASAYDNKFLQDMYTSQASVTTTDASGAEVSVTKTKAEMSLSELSQVQQAEKDRLAESTLDNNATLAALATARQEELKAQGKTGDELDLNTIFEEIKQAELAKLEEVQAREISFINDRAKADKETRKENAKNDRKESLKNSKAGKALENTKAIAGILTNPKAMASRMVESGEAETSEDARKKMQAQLDAAMGAVGNFVTELNKKGQQSATKQASVDTNLQGSLTNKTALGSYWRKLSALVTSGVGVSPFIKQESVEAKIETLAGMGISYNIQQRAFLDTIKDKIATTFEAADGTLLKLIRIQQADTTAARLGMESALTSFLNSMYETSEYMHEAAKGIRQSLYEATALMGAESATEYEYQVQKWLGSLYSVGFSNAQGIADTLGKITAGDISGITEGGMGNLLIMAANEASLPIAEILEKGLTPDQTNKLMKSMVDYLAKIYDETGSSNVLAQQYANVFGVTASDLKAAANLAQKGLDTVEGSNKNYSALEQHLKTMENSLILRTSTAEFMDNLKTNLSYTFATTLANNPVLSGLNNMANMLNDLVGGIKIPFINVFGFGFDLNASIADLMNVAALSGTVLGGMGKLIAGLAKPGSGMLSAFGINVGDGKSEQVKTKGFDAAAQLAASGATTSQSGSYIGNESGDDIKEKTISDNSEDPEKQIAEAKEEQEDKENARTQLIAGHIIDIYNILNDVVLGTKKWHVQLDVGTAPASWAGGTWT